jgi:phospholipase/lecithinase/hemolysin
VKKQLLGAGFLLLSLMSPLKASATNPDQLYIFGDSLSDTGNTFNVTGGLTDPTKATPPDPPFFQGRFSNGQVWVDYVGDQLGLSPTLFSTLQTRTIPTQGINYAFGGASSGKGNLVVPNAPLPGVLEQVQAFAQPLLTSNQKADPKAVYAVWGGGNDFLFSNLSDSSQIVKNILDSVTLLAQVGAKNILVFNLPDLGKIPFAYARGVSSQLTVLSTSYNSSLATGIANLRTNPAFTGVNIIPVDINSLFNRVIASPEEFGFKNVTTPCVIGDLNNIASVCNNPDDYLFYDAVHPTTNAHKLIAATALCSIKFKTILGFSSVPDTFKCGGFGTLEVFKPKRKQYYNFPIPNFNGVR